jgi:hypothetical protein
VRSTLHIAPSSYLVDLQRTELLSKEGKRKMKNYSIEFIGGCWRLYLNTVDGRKLFIDYDSISKNPLIRLRNKFLNI